jgi:hypothetical protein
LFSLILLVASAFASDSAGVGSDVVVSVNTVSNNESSCGCGGCTNGSRGGSVSEQTDDRSRDSLQKCQTRPLLIFT